MSASSAADKNKNIQRIKTMKKLKLNISPCIVIAILLLAVSCSDNLLISPLAEGTPLTITAEIGSPAFPGTRVAVASNSYDRSGFMASDQINVVCSRGGVQLASSGYTLNASATAWEVASGSSGLGFLPATVCRASFPIAYDGILADQQSADGSSFLKSNYLLTPEVPISGAEVSFTGDNSFKHENAKLTLKFQGAGGVALPAFTRITVQATGLQTGGTGTESITPFRPDPAVHTWCAVVYPRAQQDTEITITVIDRYSVTYKTNILCNLAKATSYTYTLQIRNDILVPVGGAEIKDWELEVRHSEGFDSEERPN